MVCAGAAWPLSWSQDNDQSAACSFLWGILTPEAILCVLDGTWLSGKVGPQARLPQGRVAEALRGSS